MPTTIGYSAENNTERSVPISEPVQPLRIYFHGSYIRQRDIMKMSLLIGQTSHTDFKRGGNMNEAAFRALIKALELLRGQATDVVLFGHNEIVVGVASGERQARQKNMRLLMKKFSHLASQFRHCDVCYIGKARNRARFID